jgi:phosphoglycolate phosphatase
MVIAVIYDLDGTLIDSRADLADSVNAMLSTLGLPERDEREIWSFVGEGAEPLVRRSLGASHEHLFPEAIEQWRIEYSRRLLSKTRPYPGIAELLEAPPSARAVLTNKPGGFAREILRGLGFAGKFHSVVGGDEAPKKPDPTGLLGLCSALGAAPVDTLYVGDSRIDLATGAAAGVPVCAAGWGLGDPDGLRNAGPAYFCSEPADVARLLARLAAV